MTSNKTFSIDDFTVPSTREQLHTMLSGFMAKSRATGTKHELEIVRALVNGPKTTPVIAEYCRAQRTNILIALRALEKRRIVQEIGRIRAKPNQRRPVIVWSLT